MSIPLFPRTGAKQFDSSGDLFVSRGMGAPEVSAEFHVGAVERCVGTHVCAQVCVRAFAHGHASDSLPQYLISVLKACALLGR